MQNSEKNNVKMPKKRYIGKKKLRNYEKEEQANKKTDPFNDTEKSPKNYRHRMKRKFSSGREDTRENKAQYYKDSSTNIEEKKINESLNNSTAKKYVKREIKKDGQRKKKVNIKEAEKSRKKEGDNKNSDKVNMCEGNENLINTRACEFTRDTNEREECAKANVSDEGESLIQKAIKTKDKKSGEGKSSFPDIVKNQNMDDEKMKKIDTYDNDNSSNESSDYIDSQNEILSLGNLELEKKEKNPHFEIKFRNSKKNEKIDIEKIKKLLKNKDYESLKEYQFPFMNLGAFNIYIFQITIDVFRRLFFYCPICLENFRQYSLPYHIFQNHFTSIDEYLSEREIAMSCAILMKKEYKKIDLALNTFSQLATLFESCKYKGNSETIHDAEQSIKDLKEMKIDEKFFNTTLNEAKNALNKMFPINKNKNRKRVYKSRVTKNNKKKI